jgi:hypothetical protein
MAISFKDKIAYVNKFADKADEKLQKVIKLSVNIESPKLNLTDAQKDKIKSSLQTAFDRIKKIEDEKTGTGKKPRQPNLMALTKQIQTKQGITFEQARTKAKQAFAAKKSGQTNAIQAVLQDFKSKVGKLAYSRATKGTDIKRDMERPALKEGKRKVTTQGYTTNKYGTFKNKVGSVYYENRANRIDINQPSKKRYPKLADGGNFGSGEKYPKSEQDFTKYKLVFEDENGKTVLGSVPAYMKADAERFANSVAKQYDWKVKKVLKKYEDGGKMGYSRYNKGGSVGQKYTVYLYYGGEGTDKVYNDVTLQKAKELAMGAEHADIVDSMGNSVFREGGKISSGTEAKAERDAKRLSKTKGKMYVFKREEGEEKGNYIAVTEEQMFEELNSPYKSTFVSFFGNGKKYGDGGQTINLGSGEMTLDEAIDMYEKKIKAQGNVSNERDENMLRQLKQMKKEFGKGGKITNQYEGKSASEVWNMLTKDQRQHFLYDHADEIQAYRGDEKGELRGTEIRNASKSDWADLDKDIKNRFENHVREGEYGGGGKFGGGGYVAVGEKDGYWTIISKPSTKENAQKMLDLGSLPRGEMGKVVTVEEAKAHKKVIGREYLAYGGKMKYSRKK